MWFGLDNQNSDCVVGWTVNSATVLCEGQSIQRLCCVKDSQYSDCVVGLQSLHRMCCGLDSQYTDCVVGWTAIRASVLQAGQSVH